MGKSKKSYVNDFEEVVGKKICENKIHSVMIELV